MTRLSQPEYTEAYYSKKNSTTAGPSFTDASAIIGPFPPYAVGLLPERPRRTVVQQLSPPRPRSMITAKRLEPLSTVRIHVEEDASDVTGGIHIAVPECLLDVK